MIRDSIGEVEYWDKWVGHSLARTEKMLFALAQPSENPAYDPQYSFDVSLEFLRLTFERYSRGDPVSELTQHFAGLLEAWELSNRLADEICKERQVHTCRDWTFDLANLNHYNWCFWLVGLALTLEIPDNQWNRLVALIDAEGQDELLDRVMLTRQRNRTVGTALLHRRPYARLLKTIEASPSMQPKLLLEFVEQWHTELARKGKGELWWYIHDDVAKDPLASGNYFGSWCVEAAVVSKLFNIDDTLCLGHKYYPGDLLRPAGPSAHPNRQKAKVGFLKMLLGSSR